jgi:hypothetical protein
MAPTREDTEKLERLSILAQVMAPCRPGFDSAPIRYQGVLAFLKRIEWEGDNTIFACPFCRRWKQIGHKACALEKMIFSLEKWHELEQRRKAAVARRNVARAAARPRSKGNVRKAKGRGNSNGRGR